MEDHTVSRDHAPTTCAATPKSAATEADRALAELAAFNGLTVLQQIASLTIERILFRRALEHKLDGYTLGTSHEIVRALWGENGLATTPQPHPPQSPGDKARDDHNPKADGEQD